MKHRALGTVVGLVGGMLLVGCAAEYKAAAEYEGDEAQTQSTYGAAQEAVAACDGDSLQYDFNAFAASFAIAIANEMGHWDVATDFAVSGTGPAAKLVLSPTGTALCGTGCTNVKDILLLQEDRTAITNHSPLEFRTHLVTWYNAEKARLVDLAVESRLPAGSYQFRNKNSGKNMVVDASSTAESAKLEQGPLAGTAGNWTAKVVGAKHKFVNVNSGKCMDLASASSADNVAIVQKTCSTAATQNFDVVKVDGGFYTLKTTYGKQVVAFNWGTGNDVQLVQAPYSVGNAHGSWTANAVGGTTNPATTIFKGNYKLQFANTTLANLTAAPISAAEGAQVKLASYSAGNMLHNWYASPVGAKYQFINRGSGKCLALASDSATALLVQKTCAVHDSQLFTATAQSYAEEYTLKTRYNTLLEVQNAGTAAGTAITQTAQTQGDTQRRIRFSPIQAAEPHKLTFDHISNDAACGDYYWYNVTQPNGAPLADPMSTYIHLIFAGGKKVAGGADENPFIAQMASGSQVAIDPAALMTGGSTGATGSCIISDLVYDSTRTSAGKCCIKYNGVTGGLVASSWSPTTYLCQ